MLIGGHNGSTHTGLMLAELTDGWVDAHVHSRETTFYVLSGTPTLYLDGVGVRLQGGRLRRDPRWHGARMAMRGHAPAGSR